MEVRNGLKKMLQEDVHEYPNPFLYNGMSTNTTRPWHKEEECEGD